MRLDDQRASGNVEDRRGMRMVGGGLGIGGIVIVVAAYFLGFDPSVLLNVAEQVGTPARDAGGAQGGPDGRNGSVRLQDPRQHRGCLGQALPAVEGPVPPPDAGPL